MAKQHQQNKLSKNNQGELCLEQNVAIDDSILPSAIELEKLKEVDPDIIQWILARTEIEQNARIEYNREIISINKKNFRGERTFNLLSLILGFILIITTLGLSAYFIFMSLPVQGTIFGGATIFVFIAYYARIIRSTNKKNN